MNRDSEFEIRDLTAHSDLVEAVRLQKEIWGFQEIELLPVRLFVVATKVGGQVFGAFHGTRLIGFLLAIPGMKPGSKSYLHSHMLGVVADYQDRGVGRLLKMHQLAEARSRGIDLIEWTFDPLELKNAFFNIERLGAVVRRYVLNQYGTTTSHLHGGLPTDRCIAEWHIMTDRKPSDPVEEIEITNQIAHLRQTDPRQAREIQQVASEAFLKHFRHGLAVTGFVKREHTGAYLLSPWHSE